MLIDNDNKMQMDRLLIFLGLMPGQISFADK